MVSMTQHEPNELEEQEANKSGAKLADGDEHQQQQHQQQPTQPQELIVSQIIQSSPTSNEVVAVTSAALPPTVITTQRHRMITAAGHIREITDVQQIEQDKHYVERFQLIPVDEQTYAYEHHGNHGGQNPNQVQPNGTTASIDASDMIKRDSHSDDSEMTIREQSVPTTAYVSQSNDDAEVLRYPSNAQLRYDEDAYHQARYEYQPHPGQIPSEEIKVELVRNQHHPQQHPSHAQAHLAKLHIYEQPDGSSRAEMHHTDDNHHNEPKIHYTNLDTIVPSQPYYISTEGFQSPGSGYTYLSTGPNKDFAVFQGSPNTVLYKGDPTLTSALNSRYNNSLAQQQALYDANSVSASGSPVQQVYATSCKPESTTYWHHGAEYNVNTGFGQAIVLENPAIASAEYVANGGQWQFQLPEAYDPQVMPATDFKECVNCSTSQSAYWRRADGGHTLCHQCSFSRQSRPPKNQKAKPQAQQAANNRRSGVICANCKTSTTTLWRRNNQGEPVCNACGLYYKLHNVNRPQSMKKEGIQTRKRKPKYSLAAKAKAGMGDKMLPTIFPSHVHVQPEMKMSLMTSGHLPQVSDMHVGSSQASTVSSAATEHFLTVAPQSHSPHLPNASNLSRHINITVPPIDSPHAGKLTSVITSTGTPDQIE